MTKSTYLALSFLTAAGMLPAQPTIGGIQNNYSYQIPNTPNYGIAQGCIFILYGAGMAPAGLLQQTFDPELERNLGGVAIKITVNGTTTDAIPYYVSPNQIAAILPSATPVGTGTITVTYNGQTSAAFPITVVASAFGILTLGGNGLGNAAVYDLNYEFITPTKPAKPGQIVYFWGTGQGFDPNNETRLIPTPQNLTNIPFEFYIGNKQANVIYHGRSTYPGLDQIAVEVPAGVNGCYASAYAKTGTVISNFVSIPVSADGEACTDWFSNSTETQRALGTGKTELNLGWLYLARFKIWSPGVFGQPASMITQDSATAQFVRNTPFDASNWGAVGGFANPGCIVTSWLVQSPFQIPFVRGLNAGPSVTLTVPDGSSRTLALMQGSNSNYAFSANDATPGGALFIPQAGGNFRFQIPGGTDVGPAEATISADNPMTWNEQTTIANVSRSQPLTLTWTGGRPGGFVLIQGGSYTLNNTIFTSFGCTVPSEAGTYTVPRDVLASMVASQPGPGGIATGSLLVEHFTFPARFTASGLDHGSVVWESYSSAVVTYQ